MTLFEELMALVAALDGDGVAYALAGGLAVAVWGAPRATKDIDLLVRPEQLERALAVASRLQFDLRAQPMTFRDGMQLQRVSRARGSELLTVDFILVDDNLEVAWQSRVKLKSGERDLWLVFARRSHCHEGRGRKAAGHRGHREAHGDRPMSRSCAPTAEEVERRLRHASRLSDLSAGRRLDAKIDLSAEGVRLRLQEASDLLDACRALARLASTSVHAG